MLSEPDDVQPDDVDPVVDRRLPRILSRVEDADFERFDPPDGLWEGIAASIAAESARTTPEPVTVVEYSIDSDDVVIATDEGWSAFARANDAPELVEVTSPRALWSYFHSDEVRDLWRLILQRVRDGQVQASLPLRCDAPHMRRWFEMTITPGQDNCVHFRSVLVDEESRPTVPILNPRAPRDIGLPAVPVCSWCGEAHDGEQWRRIEDVVRDLRLLEELLPAISYGICPTCRERMSAELVEPSEVTGP